MLDFFCCWVVKLLYIFWILDSLCLCLCLSLSLLHIYIYIFAYICSHHVGHFFMFFNLPFDVNVFPLYLFSLLHLFLVSHVRNHRQIQGYKDLFVFFWEFMILAPTVNCFLHFDLIFIWGKNPVSFFCTRIEIVLTPFVTVYSFPLNDLGTLVKKINWLQICIGLFINSHSISLI
jgi:hypothetical protein